MARDEAPRSRPNHNYVVNPPPPEYMDRLNRIYKRQRARRRRVEPPRPTNMEVEEAEAGPSSTTPLESADNATVPPDLVLCFIDGVAWQVDLETGQYFPVPSDTDMSEVEVERQVEEVADDALSAAREIIRAEGLQSTGDPPDTPRHQITSGSPSAGQPQIQPSQDSGILVQGTSEPLQTQETQVILPPTRPHSPGSFSPTVQTISGQALDITGSAGGHQPTPNEGGDVPPLDRYGSVTPTPRDSHNAITTLDTSLGDFRGENAGSSRHGKQRRLEPYSDEETGPDGGDGGDIPMGSHILSPRLLQSGSGGPPRHGKNRRLEPYSDEGAGADGGDRGDILMEDSPNFISHQRQYGGSRPATEDDILRLCQSFHNLTREFIQEVMGELRRGNARRGNQENYTADDEADGDVPRRRLRKPRSKFPGIRRRPAEQNALSRQIRAHMKTLIPKDNWLKEVISQHDLNNWNPEIGECCTAQQFKLHLMGTPRSPWNISATRVFVNDFLSIHTELYPDVWAIRRMILKKTQAHIKSLIKAFRDDQRDADVKRAARRAKNRYERKVGLYNTRRDITFVYPQMEPQRRMLEALGVHGMSSDEEEHVQDGIQYRIMTPRWRAMSLAPWLRTFDALYRYHRLEDNGGDRRGCMPRRRVPTNVKSTSRRFVAGLPFNAYDVNWMTEQLDAANVVHPTEEVVYEHDPQLSQMAMTV